MNEIKPKPIFIKTFFENKIKVEPLNQYSLPLRNGNGRKNIYLILPALKRGGRNTTSRRLLESCDSRIPILYTRTFNISNIITQCDLVHTNELTYQKQRSLYDQAQTDQSLDLITRLSLYINNQLYNVCTLTSFSRIFCYDLT